MDSLYQEKLEKETVQKEVNISLDDEGIIKVLLCCQAGRSCNECPYDELNSPRCRDILLNECIGLINRLKQSKVDVAREIFAEIEQNLNNLIKYYKEKRKYATEVEYSEFEQRYCDIKVRTFEERLLKIAKLKKKYTEEKKDV